LLGEHAPDDQNSKFDSYRPEITALNSFPTRYPNSRETVESQASRNTSLIGVPNQHLASIEEAKLSCTHASTARSLEDRCDSIGREGSAESLKTCSVSSVHPEHSPSRMTHTIPECDQAFHTGRVIVVACIAIQIMSSEFDIWKRLLMEAKTD
jgi:hypothetical protein